MLILMHLVCTLVALLKRSRNWSLLEEPESSLSRWPIQSGGETVDQKQRAYILLIGSRKLDLTRKESFQGFRPSYDYRLQVWTELARSEHNIRNQTS